MNLTKDIKDYIERSVLCWLATSSHDLMPNVSPKECFTHFDTDRIIVANIASPQTVRNIKSNQNVCISFIEILIQKGYQIKGKARIVEKTDPQFESMHEVLNKMVGGKFPISTITEITPEYVKPIIAPSYLLYPETSETDQIEQARKSYGI